MKQIEVTRKGRYFSLDKIEEGEKETFVYVTDLSRGGRKHTFVVTTKQLKTLLETDFLPAYPH